MAEGKDITPLFRNEDEDENEITAELFRDRVRSVHEHFDKNEDGHLNFEELAALQKVTEGVILSEEMYVMACKALNCTPHKGISVDALKLTYASEGADIDKDYFKIFPDRKQKSEDNINDEDEVYELGANGFDVSS